MDRDDKRDDRGGPQRQHRITKDRDGEGKVDRYKEMVSRPRSNWTKEARKVEEIDPEELNRCRSDYIPDNSALMQSYLIQDNQKRLFREMISANAKVNPDEIKEAQAGQAVTQAQPVVRRESATYYYRGYVAGVNNVLMDQNKIKRKIFIPTNKGFNFAGLIIGPKGANQKRLEEETGCKILVRGKGSQKEGQPAANDDWDPLHVMIAGDSEAQVARAAAEVERIIFADEQTRSILRQEQLKIVQQIKNNEYNLPSSGYAAVEINYNALGIVNPTAYILPVPNECVGLLLGDGGETIRQIQKKAEAHNVQMQADSNPNSKTRNVYVEGSEDAFLRVKKLIDEIIDTHMRLKSVTAGAGGDTDVLINVKLSIPVKSLPTVVGKSSENLLKIEEKTGARLIVAPDQDLQSNLRQLNCSGTTSQVMEAKHEVDALIGSVFPDQVSLVTYTNQAIGGAAAGTAGSDNPELIVGDVVEDSGKLVMIDKGRNFYKDLKDYFGLQLDFVAEDGQTSGIEVVERYQDGTTKRYVAN